MATHNVIQTSFASGELSPNLFAHVDLEQYKQGCATMRNFFVDYRSGSSSRAGLKLVVQAFNSTFPVRVISFQTSLLVPYTLEFGQSYMRPLTNGAPVFETGFAINTISVSNPCIANIPGHNFVVGDWIFLSSLGGMVQLSNRFFIVAAVVGANVTLKDTYGNFVNSSAYTAYTGGGLANRIYKIASPYLGADLALLKFVQIANTMYLTHPAYPPYLLTFISPTNWTFTPITFGTTVTAPGAPTVAFSSAGSANYAYVITAVDAAGQESLPSPPGTVAGAVDIGSTAGTITASWAAVGGAASYNVYKAELSISSAVPSGAAFGYIQTVTGTVAVDSNFVPDFSQTPPAGAVPPAAPGSQNPFAGGNDPGCCCFFQQRLYYAGSNQFPQTFWGSQPGLYNNFNISDPIQADDAITGTLVSLQVNYIKAMVPMPGGLILLSTQGAWQLSGSGGGLASTTAVTPINAVATPQAYNGIGDVPPIVINQDVLYVQYKNSIVRDLTYNVYANIYTGVDISIFSNHLFTGHRVVQWAFAEEPFKTIWAVREDGIALSLTYVQDQGIKGWARHDTLGLFQSVCAVTEGLLDAAYFSVQRFIQGGFWTFIERMDTRQMPYGAEDAWCVDCATQSPLTQPAATLVASASSGTANFSASANVFSPASVGQIIRMGGGIAQVTIYNSASSVTGIFSQPISATVPNDPNATPVPATSGNWSIAPQFTTFFGLDYLNGQTVSILADGVVVTPQVVSGGSITLQQPASKVTAGLGFTPQLKTMPLDLGDVRDTIQGKRKKISAVSVRVSQTRGLYFGQSFNNMSPIKEFNQGQALGTPIQLVTGDERVIMDPLWDVPGQVCFQINDPVPATILGVIPEISVGDTAK
jgi:hypothetical protein